MTDELKKRTSNNNDFEKLPPTRRKSLLGNDLTNQSLQRGSIYTKIPNVRNYDFLTPEEAEEVNFLFTMYGKIKFNL